MHNCWLLADDVLQTRMARELRGPIVARARVSETPALPLNIQDGVATIRVEGVLTPTPDAQAQWYGEPNTTYPEIQAALEAALADENVREIVFSIDSPGGMVDGFFPLIEDIAAARASGAKLRVLASNAHSAAYGIAAAVGPITATSRVASFGSVGVAVSAFVLGDMIGKVVDMTNTDAPEKRPNFGTPEGRAVMVKYLDQLGAEFMGAIAQGRGITTDAVAAGYGRGASMLAGPALAAGMIDGIAARTLDRKRRVGYGATGMAQTDTSAADAAPEPAPQPAEPPAGDPPAENEAEPAPEAPDGDPPAGDPPANASHVLSAAEFAEFVQLRAEAAQRAEAERRTLVGELVAIGAERPVTAYVNGVLVARLASEPLADLRARVAALKAHAPAATAPIPPPPVGAGSDGLNDSQRAAAAKMTDPKVRERFVQLCNQQNAQRQGKA